MTRERRFALEARAAAVIQALVRRLPRSWVLALGRMLGRLLADLDPRHVAISTDNMRHAFPAWDEARRLRTARAVYAHFGQTLVDILWMADQPRQRLLALIVEEGRAHVDAARAAGKGVVYVTGHFGNWEFYGMAFGWIGEPVGVVARPLDNPALEERLTVFRTRSGNTVISKRRAIPDILRLLRQGAGVAIVWTRTSRSRTGSSSSSSDVRPRPRRWRPPSPSRPAARSCPSTARPCAMGDTGSSTAVPSNGRRAGTGRPTSRVSRKR